MCIVKELVCDGHPNLEGNVYVYKLPVRFLHL